MMSLTPQFKYTTDGAAATIAFGHWWGIWAGNVAAIASTAAFVWIIIQAYYFLKDRWKKKK